jgi:predicted nuclease of restriction endonuclease-like (RecB) superfamily
MDYLLEKNKIDDIQDRLQEIGVLSLFIIKHQERISKDEIWERAVEINKLGQDVYKEISRLPKS